MGVVWGVACVALGYLLGSIPVGYAIARWVRGIDIRQYGSGNVGATNVGRVLGHRWGLLVLGLDALKGALPVALLPKWLLPPGTEGFQHWQVAVGVGTIVGHMYPLFLGLRGGKGVATALGVVSCLAPLATLIAGGAFLVTFGIWQYVSLGAIVAAVVFALAQFGKFGATLFSGSRWSLGVFSLLVPTLIILRHRSNIGRLLRGEEPRYGSTKKGEGKDSPPASSRVDLNRIWYSCDPTGRVELLTTRQRNVSATASRKQIRRPHSPSRVRSGGPTGMPQSVLSWAGRPLRRGDVSVSVGIRAISRATF